MSMRSIHPAHSARALCLRVLGGVSLVALIATAQAQPTLAPLPPSPDAPDYVPVPLIAAAPSSSNTQRVPMSAFDPLVTPATQRLLPGKIVFSMLVTPDLTKAENFYGPLFGWSFRPVNGGKHPRVEIMQAGRAIGTMVAHPLDNPKQDVPFWLPFISTSDTATVARVTKRYGGHVLFGPRKWDGLGQAVIVSDPQQGIYAALSAQSGDPEDLSTAPMLDSFSWATLLTPSPSTAAGYYQMLFNYQVTAAPEADSGAHYILSSQGQERASVNTLPPDVMPRDKARWIQFVQVRNSATTATRAVSLGGQVIVPTHVDRDGALISVIADPTGAVFGVIEAQRDMLEMGPAQ